MKGIIALMLSALLAGCMTVGQERVEKLPSGAKLVPLSLLGNAMPIIDIGMTIFQCEQNNAEAFQCEQNYGQNKPDVVQYKQNRLDVTDWQMDSFIETTAARIVRDGKKFDALESSPKGASVNVGKLVNDFWANEGELRGGSVNVMTLAKETGADYILVLGPLESIDPFFGTNETLSGYGVFQRSMFGIRRAINYLMMRVILLDGKTGKEIAHSVASLNAPRANNNWMESGNLMLSADDTKQTKASLQALTSTLLQKALVDLKLIP
ncbi:MAG: hypothetical protein LUQ11_13805 [Methylococcaceae bacterium]|nr:hypothetical protein [Methylococcaceae bacterium]